MTPLEALERCRRAWEASQPQLPLELYPDVGLGDTHERPRETHDSLGVEAAAVRVAEPAAPPALPLVEGAAGSTVGAEPHRGT